jgi:RNA-directed DNA polymerase
MHCKIQLVMCTDDGRGTYAVVRYADDLVVFSPTPAEAVEGQRRLSAWLGTRGWRWSDEKTHIRHLREGFNFLGFTIRHYPTPQRSRSRYTLLLKPSQTSLPQMKWKRKGLWHTPVGSPTVALINAMNPV